MLENLKEGLKNAINKIIGADTVDEEVVSGFVKDIQRALIQADVNVRLVLDVSERIRKRALDEKPPAGISRKDQIIKILYEELSSMLGEEKKFELSRGKTNTIMMVGVQGSGKTSTVAKLARYLTKKNYKVGVIAADTFRPGAVAQLKTLCELVGVDIYSDEKEKDPVKISREGKKYFDGKKDVIIIDTAGRHKEERSLLEEMEAIAREVKPDLNILVVDGTIGQQCYSQALAFHQAFPVGGIIVTKLDGASKGGGALAAVAATGAKILFVTNGERIDDIEEFSPTRFVGRLLGLGDIKALLEMIRQSEVEVDEKTVKRMMTGKITMNDLLYQLEQTTKIGSLKKILEHIPGLSGAIKENDLQKVEEKIPVYRSIIQSMTREEREAPEIINSSRIKRIALGSGRSERDVRELLARYKQMKTFMKMNRSRELRQMLRRMGKGVNE
jgi:signal recognition particle subunit SRP54